MFNPNIIVAVILLYVLFLFIVAVAVERRAKTGRNPGNNAIIYSLSLAVYCTTWTYYGSVGKAANSGLLFLTIYAGPTLGALFWWVVLRKLVRIKAANRITSLADFISARYDKSPVIAAAATIIAFIGTAPYIALQLKAMLSTFKIITRTADIAYTSWTDVNLGLLLAIMMIVFTIMFGARRLDPTERHQGMVVVLVVECLLKLFAFVAAGLFVTYYLYDGMGDIMRQVAEKLPEVYSNLDAGNITHHYTWLTYLILGMSAIIFLPRQFHVAVVENFDERHIRTAAWLFPAYIFLINIFVLPIALGGLLHGFPGSAADTFVLLMPMKYGTSWLALLVFVGGCAAATGMILITTMTMATMITNHIMIPVIEWVPRLGFLRRHLLKLRWLAIAGFILLGYWFQGIIGDTYMLVSIGIMSFAAVLQFAPASIGGIFWRAGNKHGALMGMCAGFLVWFYTLMLPAVAKSGWISTYFIHNGLWSIDILRPEHLFGVSILDPISHSVFWSMLVNISLYILGSLCFKQSKDEQKIANEFVGILNPAGDMRQTGRERSYIKLKPKRTAVLKIFRRYFSRKDAEVLAEKCIAESNLSDKKNITVIELAELQEMVEKHLSGSIGKASAHQTIRSESIFSEEESTALSTAFSEILTTLRVSPGELKSKIDYYKERDALMTQHSAELEAKVDELEEHIAKRKRVENELETYKTHLEELVRARTQELKEAQEKLVASERLAVLGQFSGSVAHEIRNPLGVISAAAYYLKRKNSGDDEKIIAKINMIMNQTNRVAEIIDSILKLTRMETPDLKNVNLADAVRAVLSDVPDGITLEWEPPVDDIIVQADWKQLNIALNNIVRNAVQAMNDKGTLTVRIRIVPDNGTNWAEVLISDTGPGISKEHLDKIFTPLFTKKIYGIGFGLSIVKMIIERHNGTIVATSNPGNGAAFTLRLPLPEP